MIAQDKVLHLAGGAALCLVAGLLARSPVWGLAAALAAGGLKELVVDRYIRRGDVSAADFGATAAGGILAVLPLLLLLR